MQNKIKNYKKIKESLLKRLNMDGRLYKATIVKQTSKDLNLNESTEARDIMDVYFSLIGNEGEWVNSKYQDTIKRSPKYIVDNNTPVFDRLMKILIENISELLKKNLLILLFIIPIIIVSVLKGFPIDWSLIFKKFDF